MHGHLDFRSSAGEVQSVEAAGGPIPKVRPLGDSEDRELLVITEKTERINRRGDDVWADEGMGGAVSEHPPDACGAPQRKFGAVAASVT